MREGTQESCVDPDNLPVNDSVEDICEAGSLIEPKDGIQQLETVVNAADPVTFAFPEIQDSGSIDNDDETGLKACGSRTYKLLGGDTYLTQIERELSLQTVYQADSGYHIVEMMITLDDYPEVEPLYVDIPIYIEEC